MRRQSSGRVDANAASRARVYRVPAAGCCNGGEGHLGLLRRRRVDGKPGPLARSRPYRGAIKNFGRAPSGRAASTRFYVIDRWHFQQRAEWSAPEATAESRIVTSANSGPLAKARRRSRRIRSALRRDQISVNPSSPPLPVTSELIDVGAASFLTPRLDPCSPGVLWPRPTRRAAIRNHATSLARSRLFRR